MATASSPNPHSKNPFLNPPNSNNPFLRPHLTGSASAESLSIQPTSPQPLHHHQQPPALPARRPTGNQDPFLEAALVPIPETPAVSQNPTPGPLSQQPPPQRPSSVPLPTPSATSSTPNDNQPIRNPEGLTEDEALEAAIALSIWEGQAAASASANPAAVSASPTAEQGPTQASTRTWTPPPGPPPQSSTSAANPSPTATRNPVRSETRAPSYDTEEPPPYSSTADADFGERTLEVGPRRPFQNTAPAARPANAAGGRFVAPTPTGGSASGGWSQFPGAVGAQTTGRGGSQANSGPAPSGGYTPPAGPPPGASSSNTAARTGGGASTTAAAADDGTPTTTATPGRPLLNKGRTLVYPPGHTCYKCHNTGYKSYDPLHPCSKCWPKYGRPYTGPLTYAPWSNRAPDTNFQRPLPKTVGPWDTRPGLSAQGSSTFGRSSWGGSGDRDFMRDRFAPGLSGSLTRAGSSVTPLRGPPPAGSLVVRPGDPRIGGRLCWNCGGDGVVSFFIFDSERCPTCNGMGRIV